MLVYQGKQAFGRVTSAICGGIPPRARERVGNFLIALGRLRKLAPVGGLWRLVRQRSPKVELLVDLLVARDWEAAYSVVDSEPEWWYLVLDGVADARIYGKKRGPRRLGAGESS